MRSYLQYPSMTGRRRWSRVLENVFSEPLQKSRRATGLYWRPRQPKWVRSRKREQARLLPNRRWSAQGRYKSVTTIPRSPIRLQANRLNDGRRTAVEQISFLTKSYQFHRTARDDVRPHALGDRYHDTRDGAPPCDQRTLLARSGSRAAGQLGLAAWHSQRYDQGTRGPRTGTVQRLG
jgi:hypothetical protein